MRIRGVSHLIMLALASTQFWIIFDADSSDRRWWKWRKLRLDFEVSDNLNSRSFRCNRMLEKKKFSQKFNFTILRISENQNSSKIQKYLTSIIKKAPSSQHPHEPEVSLIHRTRRYRIKSLTRSLGGGAYWAESTTKATRRIRSSGESSKHFTRFLTSYSVLFSYFHVVRGRMWMEAGKSFLQLYIHLGAWKSLQIKNLKSLEMKFNYFVFSLLNELRQNAALVSKSGAWSMRWPL